MKKVIEEIEQEELTPHEVNMVQKLREIETKVKEFMEMILRGKKVSSTIVDITIEDPEAKKSNGVIELSFDME